LVRRPGQVRRLTPAATRPAGGPKIARSRRGNAVDQDLNGSRRGDAADQDLAGSRRRKAADWFAGRVRSAGSRRRLRSEAADPRWMVATAVTRWIMDRGRIIRRLTPAATRRAGGPKMNGSHRGNAVDNGSRADYPPAHAGGYQLFPVFPVATAVTRWIKNRIPPGLPIRRLTPAATGRGGGPKMNGSHRGNAVDQDLNGSRRGDAADQDLAGSRRRKAADWFAGRVRSAGSRRRLRSEAADPRWMVATAVTRWIMDRGRIIRRLTPAATRRAGGPKMNGSHRGNAVDNGSRADFSAG